MLTYRVRLLSLTEALRFLFIFLFIFSLHSVNAQRRPLVKQWAKSFGGTNFDDAYSVFHTSDGGFVFAGRALSTNGLVTNTVPGRGKCIIKTDSLGNINWQRSYGDGNAIRSIIQTVDGGFAVCGMTSTANPLDGGDFWIAKLNAVGGMEWQRNYGGANQDLPNKIIQTRDGNYVIVGVTGSSDRDITDRPSFPGYEYDYWALKLDFAGNILWSKTYGGSGSDQAHGVAEKTDGSLLIVGGSYSSDGDIGDHKQPGLYYSDCWLIETNANGVLQWSKSYGSGGSSYGYSVCQNSDGGFTIGGITDANGFDVMDHSGGGMYDYWVVRTNATGIVQWSHCFGGTGNDYLQNLVPSRYGGYLMTGISNSTDGDVTGTKGGGDYWVVSIDDTGNFVWGQCHGGSLFEYSTALQETRDGGVIVTGFAESANGDVTDHFGTIDFWSVKLGHKIATAPISPLRYCAGDSITVKDTLFGTFNPNNMFTIQLSDINGSFTNPMVIAGYTLNNSDSSFRVALPPGILPGNRYRVRVVSSSPIATYVDNGQDITINALPVITKDFLGRDTTLCNAAVLSLQAPSGFVYRWQDNSSNNQYQVSAPGNYSVIVSNASGCSVKDSILVSYNSIPDFTLGNDTAVCTGEVVTLRPALPPGNYLWNTGSQSTTLSLANNGWYWLQVSNVNCSKRDSLFFTVKPNPSIKFGNDTTLCEGVRLLLDVTNAGATYMWQDGSTSSQFNVDRAGTYAVSVTLDGCDTSADIRVDYVPVPRVSLGRDTTLCTDEMILLNATFPGAKYLWSTGSQDPQLRVTREGVYAVTVSNACATVHDTISVDFEDCVCFVQMPSAFSPNNDGRNEFFKAYSRCTIEAYELKVFNRYGQMVFTTRNQSIGWDGKFGAQYQPVGTYIWILQYRDPVTGRTNQRKGTVELIR